MSSSGRRARVSKGQTKYGCFTCKLVILVMNRCEPIPELTTWAELVESNVMKSNLLVSSVRNTVSLVRNIQPVPLLRLLEERAEDLAPQTMNSKDHITHRVYQARPSQEIWTHLRLGRQMSVRSRRNASSMLYQFSHQTTSTNTTLYGH